MMQTYNGTKPPLPLLAGYHHQPEFKFLKYFLLLGIAELVTGSIVLGLGGYSMFLYLSTKHSYFLTVFPGLWCGPFFITAGVFAVLCSQKPSIFLIKCTIVIGSSSAVLGLVMYGFEIAKSTVLSSIKFKSNDDLIIYKIFNGFLVGMGLLNFFLAKIIVALSISSLCSKQNEYTEYNCDPRQPLLQHRKSNALSPETCGANSDFYPYPKQTETVKPVDFIQGISKSHA